MRNTQAGCQMREVTRASDSRHPHLAPTRRASQDERLQQGGAAGSAGPFAGTGPRSRGPGGLSLSRMDVVVAEDGGNAHPGEQDMALARLREVLRHAPMVLLAIDADGTFSLVDGGALPSWQGASKPSVGASMYDLVEDSPELVDGFAKALAGQSQRCRTYVGERIFELSFSPAGGAGDAAVRACCVGKDITERAESEKQRIAEQLASFEEQRRMEHDLA